MTEPQVHVVTALPDNDKTKISSKAKKGAATGLYVLGTLFLVDDVVKRLRRNRKVETTDETTETA